MKVDTLRLVGPPGSNKIMAGELSRLVRRGTDGIRLATPKKAGTGALVYPFDGQVARMAVCYGRTPSRVLWDLYLTRASRLEPLYQELLADAESDERSWSWDGATISIRARNVGDFAAGERQLVGAVKNAIIDGAARRGQTLSVSADDADILLAVRMHDDEVSVSVDLGGRSLHQRGYRRDGGIAPLRENLAAVLVMLSRFDARREVLVDPMMGSGTIAIEAALMASGQPLGQVPAAARLPALQQVMSQPTPPLFADTQALIIGNEIDTRVVAAARSATACAGVADQITALHGDFRQLTRERIEGAMDRAGRAGQTGVILTNPPYGARLDREDPRDLYRDLGQFCRAFSGWRAGILVANPDFAGEFGGTARIVKPLRNGNQAATFYLYDL